MRFSRVVGAGRVAGGRADAAVVLGDQVVGGQLLVPAVAPVAAGVLVQHLGEGLGQAVGQGLDHDRVVVVVVGLEARRQLVGAEPGRDGERADVVGQAGSARRDEVGQRVDGLALAFCALLAEHVEAGQLAGRARRRCRGRCRRRRPRPARSRRRRGPPGAARARSARAAPGRWRRARGPPGRTPGRRGWRGTCPRSSQAVKKKVQSMYGTSSASGGSHDPACPVNAGAATSCARQSIGVRLAMAGGVGQQGRPGLAAVHARAGAPGPRGCGRRTSPPGLGVEQARDDADAREASSTCVGGARVRRGDLHRGVLGWSWPRRSTAAGRMPWRSISRATWTISSRVGVISPDRPIRSTPSCAAVSRICSRAPSRPGR